MLVLRRSEGRAIHLFADGREVARFIVLSIEDGGRVKIGVEAPLDVEIVRDELLMRAGGNSEPMQAQVMTGEVQ